MMPGCSARVPLSTSGLLQPVERVGVLEKSQRLLIRKRFDRPEMSLQSCECSPFWIPAVLVIALPCNLANVPDRKARP